MTNEDKQTMEAHGISCESKDYYFYRGFRYERLADAVRYAKIEAAQQRPPVLEKPAR